MNAPSASAAAANSRGMAALQSGRFQDAAAAFREACVADPTSGALLRNLASAHRATGDDAAELQALEAALNIDRRDLIAWLRKAEVHQRLEQKGEALTAWSGAIQLAEPLKPWTGALAEALERGQRFCNGAVADLRTAVDRELDPLAAGLDETERRRSGAFVDMALGGRRRFTNECAGLYYPFLPADEYFDDRHFPWFADLAGATEAIRAELLALLEDPGEQLRPYVRMEKGVPDNKWSELDHTLSWGACFLWEYGEPNRAVLERCPQTAKALAAIPQSYIPNRSPSAFFSMLRPHTRIPPHTGVTNTRAIVHLPLIVPPGCGFRVGGETRQWEIGKPFAFDDTIEHEAWNDSDELRAILICDVWNPHLTPREQEMIVRYYQAADAAGYSPAGGS
ncbi:aspartyl/asparaginyl beta-hydroxylase domain-containing protein [Sphingomonas sp. GCM10030256]|uniref:aspartyl/asparaginyl beta-hydroxylase domain-containing protein n=1 Tax=Sphingomonas sp. GCM10030256 TaxID=3273427 RepID=UPI003617E163